MSSRIPLALALIAFLASPLAGGAAAAQEFTVNPRRIDPYKQFKFRVLWDGRAVPGIWRVSGLVRTTEVLQFRQGGEPNVVHRRGRPPTSRSASTAAAPTIPRSRSGPTRSKPWRRRRAPRWPWRPFGRTSGSS
jgi:hypothetical protein